MSAANLEVYNRPDVAAHYAVLDYLTPCERYLFELYIQPGAAILDLGVGGGRTTPYLSTRASRYVGVDYAVEMIRACRRKHPSLEFMVAEASDLSKMAACSFDAVVFAFNGLDYVIPGEARMKCLKECHRILKPDGILLFSGHNPRSIFVRPFWSRPHVRKLANAIGAGSGHFTTGLAYSVLSHAAALRAFFRAGWSSAIRILTRVPSRAFRRGDGYGFDSAHGGLTTHYGIPQKIVAEVEQHGFRPLRILGDDYPAKSGEYITDWYYYVFSKLDLAGDLQRCA
jgi:SAM-dependent methyltransferase